MSSSSSFSLVRFLNVPRDVPHVGINLMTTQVNLSEDVVRGLTKLGVKMVMRPSECTHLLAASVVRTEKFLCALAKAPFILSEKWATQSVAAKKLLGKSCHCGSFCTRLTIVAEKDFLLVDNGGESKYGVKLVRSIQRAKENKGALFSGHTFYVTTKVPTDRKLLKNVVAAHGGEVSDAMSG